MIEQTTAVVPTLKAFIWLAYYVIESVFISVYCSLTPLWVRKPVNILDLIKDSTLILFTFWTVIFGFTFFNTGVTTHGTISFLEMTDISQHIWDQPSTVYTCVHD